MVSRRIRAAGVLLLAACEGAGTAERGARYELAGADGRILPAFLGMARGGCMRLLQGGEVLLDGENGFRANYDIRETCNDSTRALPDPGTVGSFQVRNDTAFFTDSTGNPTGYGFITADSLVLQGTSHRLKYTRRTRE
jgi:hypothetical protein